MDRSESLSSPTAMIWSHLKVKDRERDNYYSCGQSRSDRLPTTNNSIRRAEVRNRNSQFKLCVGNKSIANQYLTTFQSPSPEFDFPRTKCPLLTKLTPIVYTLHCSFIAIAVGGGGAVTVKQVESGISSFVDTEFELWELFAVIHPLLPPPS